MGLRFWFGGRVGIVGSSQDLGTKMTLLRDVYECWMEWKWGGVMGMAEWGWKKYVVRKGGEGKVVMMMKRNGVVGSRTLI